MLISELTHFLIRSILTIVTVEAVNRVTPRWLRARYLVPVFATLFTLAYSIPGIGGGSSALTGDQLFYYSAPEPQWNWGKILGDTIGTIAISYMLYVYFGKTLVQKLFNRFMRAVEE